MIGEESLAELSIAEGFDSALPASQVFDWFATVISQYANSPVLLSLIENIASHVDPTADVDAFFTLVFNVDTAVAHGLDVWGRIVGVSRVLQLPSVGDYFGFSESGDAHSFDEAPFYGGGTLTQNYALSDAAYRRLILAKALANICDGSIPAINQILINLFSQYGNCYVTDGGNMTMTYTFGSHLSQVDFAIVSQSGVLPRPAGVSATIVQL
jgi:hypothetical protein